ncbi:TPA: hypothetical protein ACH3X1_011165 [Trebouxia sp. C0004]
MNLDHTPLRNHFNERTVSILALVRSWLRTMPPDEDSGVCCLFLLHCILDTLFSALFTECKYSSGVCCLFGVFHTAADKAAKPDKQQRKVDATDAGALNITTLDLYKRYNPELPTQSCAAADVIVLDDVPPTDDANEEDTALQQSEEELEASLTAAEVNELCFNACKRVSNNCNVICRCDFVHCNMDA